MNTRTPEQQRISLAVRLFGENKISLMEAAEVGGVRQDQMEEFLRQNGLLKKKTILVCGGAGFIGSNFIHHILAKYPQYNIINYDKLTYAGNLENLRNIEKDPRYTFLKGDIADPAQLEEPLRTGVDLIVNFAAETHVGRSVLFRADEFVRTNVLGTHNLLEAMRRHPEIERLVHISTDEVYGTTALEENRKFTEESAFLPNVPYAAAKGGGDLLCRSCHRSYGTPVIVTHCSNNYGPYQHPEKLIPNSLFRALRNQPITLHGNGQHIRDWIYVSDHCEALDLVMHKGKAGEVYNIGADNERPTFEIAKIVLQSLGKPDTLITLVPDRPGNDLRYAIDNKKIREELGWTPKYSFESAIHKTIQWYRNNIDWVEAIKERDKEFSKYI